MSFALDAYLYGYLSFLMVIAVWIVTQNNLALGSAVTGCVVFLAAAWISELIYIHWSNPLPSELQTFRDLAVWIAEHDGDAKSLPANVSPTQS